MPFTTSMHQHWGLLQAILLNQCRRLALKITFSNGREITLFRTGEKSAGSIHAFYTALDPTASSSYGGADGDWLLYRVELPRGLKYLEMEPEPPIPPQILSYPSNKAVIPA